MLFAACCVLLINAADLPRAAAQSAAWKPERLWLAGSKDHAWIVASDKGPNEGVGELRMLVAGRSAATADGMPSGSIHLQPFNGDPVAVAADVDGLKILLSDGTIWNFFHNRAAGVGSLWKEQASSPPLAWSGDDSQPVVFAVVPTSALVVVAEPTTQSADAEPPDTARTLTRPDAARPAWLVPQKGSMAAPDSAYTLLMLRRGVWQRFAMPAITDEASEFWLAARNERGYLYWRDAERRLRHAEFHAGKWSASVVTSSRADILAAWAGSTPNGPILIAGAGTDASALKLHLYAPDSNGDWHETGMVREGADYLSIDTSTSSVGTALGRLIIARFDNGRQIEFAWGDATGSPVMRFAPMLARVETQRVEPSWRTMLFPIIVLGVMTVMLLRRRDEVMRPAVVPAGYAIAPVWKRLAATLIDFVPGMIAGVFATALMRDSLNLSDDFGTLMEQFRTDPTLADRLLPAHLLMVAVYGLWCMMWELSTGTTLGKRLFGCRVLSADGAAPDARQIIIRNLIRMLMVSLQDIGLLITFLTMVLLTRNTQRLGDVLARTIVIHPGPVGERSVADLSRSDDEQKPDAP